jgi:hypothetical protein
MGAHPRAIGGVTFSALAGDVGMGRVLICGGGGKAGPPAGIFMPR